MQNSLNIVIVIIINHYILMFVRSQCINAVLGCLQVLLGSPIYEFKSHNYDVQGLRRFIILVNFIFVLPFPQRQEAFLALVHQRMWIE